MKKVSIETVIEQLNEEKERRQENGEGINGTYNYFNKLIK